MSLESLLFETLKLLGGKKSKNSFNFLKPNLLIKHKEAGVKYTISRIKFSKETKKPSVICYRYSNPNSKIKKKVFIKIDEDDFNKYEPV